MGKKNNVRLKKDERSFVIELISKGTAQARKIKRGRAVSGHIHGIIKKMYERLPQKDETDLKNKWHLLDYGDVIVHIMRQEERQYYAIEKFWCHACKINPQEWWKEIGAISFENL